MDSTRPGEKIKNTTEPFQGLKAGCFSHTREKENDDGHLPNSFSLVSVSVALRGHGVNWSGMKADERKSVCTISLIW